MRQMVLIGFALSLVSGCNFVFFSNAIPGSGVPLTEVREIPDFHAVRIEGSGDLEIQVTDGTRCEITCDDNLMEHVLTDVADGTLVIKYNQNVGPKVGLTIKLHSKAIDSIQIAGASKATVRDVDADAMAVEVAGAADVTMEGRAESTEITIAGAGDVNSLDLASKSVKVSISGSGEVQVSAVDSLDVTIAGSGSVRYRGEPTVKKSIFGSGTVERISEPSAGQIEAE